VEILEQKVVAGQVWGRTSAGWICLTGYVELKAVEEVVSAAAEPAIPLSYDQLYAGSKESEEQ